MNFCRSTAGEEAPQKFLPRKAPPAASQPASQPAGRPARPFVCGAAAHLPAGFRRRPAPCSQEQKEQRIQAPSHPRAEYAFWFGGGGAAGGFFRCFGVFLVIQFSNPSSAGRKAPAGNGGASSPPRAAASPFRQNIPQPRPTPRRGPARLPAAPATPAALPPAPARSRGPRPPNRSAGASRRSADASPPLTSPRPDRHSQNGPPVLFGPRPQPPGRRRPLELPGQRFAPLRIQLTGVRGSALQKCIASVPLNRS